MLSKEQNPGDLAGSATVRHWYFCRGLSADTPTAEEQLAGIKVAQDLKCSREFTFKQLCCADFERANQYVTLDAEGPYFGARAIVLSGEMAQQTGADAYSLVNDAAGLDAGTQTLRLCTTQYATAKISGGSGSGPVMLGGQTCLNEEFLPADLANGELLLDKRINFLEKQGLPGTSIPVCHKQFGAGETCPAESARAKNGKVGFNSASAATLKRIGQPLPGQALVRIEEELDALPENQPLTRAEEEGKKGRKREHRSQVKTLAALGKMEPKAITELLDGAGLDVALKGKVLRLKVDDVTGGDEVEIKGTVDGEAALVRISKTRAELEEEHLGRRLTERLGLEDVVLSTLGRNSFDAVWDVSEGMVEGEYYYKCGQPDYYFPCEWDAPDGPCGTEGYYFPCACTGIAQPGTKTGGYLPANCLGGEAPPAEVAPAPPAQPAQPAPPAPPAEKPVELIGPGELKTRVDDLCMDYNYNNQNVYMHPCHGGSNQIFRIEPNGEMKTNYNDKCLDYNYNNQNVYMHPCHGGKNQQWYIDPNNANQLKTHYNEKCLDYDVGQKNVIMWDCHGNANQQWYFNPRQAPPPIPLERKGPGHLKTKWDDLCMDYNYNNNNVYMHPCHGGANQVFKINPANGEMQTNYDNKCLDYNYNNNNVYMHPCHGGKNQKWKITEGKFELKTDWDNKCLDYNYNNKNVYMHPCHGGTNQQWYFS